MELTQEISGTAEQRESCAVARQLMSAFMVSNGLVGIVIGADLKQQWTTSALNLSSDLTVFVNDGEGKVHIDPEITRLTESLMRQFYSSHMIDDAAIEKMVVTAQKTVMTLIAVSELRKALVDRLDSIIEMEHKLKGMVSDLPPTILHMLTEREEG